MNDILFIFYLQLFKSRKQKVAPHVSESIRKHNAYCFRSASLIHIDDEKPKVVTGFRVPQGIVACQHHGTRRCPSPVVLFAFDVVCLSYVCSKPFASRCSCRQVILSFWAVGASDFIDCNSCSHFVSRSNGAKMMSKIHRDIFAPPLNTGVIIYVQYI